MEPESSVRPLQSDRFENAKAVLREVAQHFGRPASDAVLFSGIPEGEGSTDEFADRVLNRIGISIADSAESKRLTPAQLPALLVLADQSFVFAKDAAAVRTLIEAGGRFIRFLPLELVYSNSSARAEADEVKAIDKEHWLFGPMGAFWKNYATIALAAMFINLLALASPIFIMNVYDRILPNKATSSLLALAAGVGLAMLFDLLLKSARARIIDQTGRALDQKISYNLFDKVLHSSMAARVGSTGEYASRLTQVDFVREFFTSNTISTLIDAAFVFVFLGVIYLIAGWLFLIPAVAFVLAILVGLVAQYRIGKRVARAANESAQRQSMLVESISTLETIKSLRAEGHLLNNWSHLTKASSKTSEDIKRLSSDAANFTQFVQQLVSIFVVIAGAFRFSQGDMSSGAIIAAVMLSGRTVSPLGQIAMTLARLKQAVLSLKILDGIMAQEEDRPNTTGFVNREVKDGSFAFEDVSFVYPGSDAKVLRNISFTVRPGERIGIIGKIGSGKTTLGRLLSSIYTPSEGRVLIDGIDVRQYHPAEVRGAVAYAGQSVDLFTGTLKQNLLYANEKATDEEIIEAARKTGVDEFASQHPRGYDMMVGERGSALSGGQKQAVAMTRLLLGKPKIVFLDEPSGALDMATERQLIGSLADSFGPGVTLVISTHRYSLLELVDRLMVVDRGRIVADGPKAQVMAGLAEKAKRQGAVSSVVRAGAAQ